MTTESASSLSALALPPLSEQEIKAVKRIIWARSDMARYMVHQCSTETCMPMSEIELINSGKLTAPIVCSNVYVCQYYIVHICHTNIEQHQCKTVNLELIIPTAIGICYGCPMRTEEDHMVCAISNKVIGFNISGISYASGGYRKADLVAADKQQRNDDSGSTGNSSLDASMLRLEITQDQIVKATRDVFHSLFHPECIGPPIRALQKYEIGKAVAKIRQEYKSSYNNYMTPNLLFILENQFRKFRNVTIAVPETLPQNYHSVCEYVVAVVTHCFKIRCIAQTQQQRLANRGQSEQANAGSKNPVNGKNTSGYTGSRRSTRKPVNVKLEPKAFALAVIYKMQTGYKFEERIVIPQSSFVSQHFPSVNVLKDVGLEKTGITKVSNVIVEYCSILQEVQMLDQLKFLPDASGTTPVNNVLLGKEGAPDRPTAMLKQ